ncbi:aminodeoxychorismate lyase [Enterococcus plantarum]|uniref:endolytic transglycosylase MltG n=1 Tax=Enterococcus plantarum TaxID=1077675 RepID=UPI00084D9084|nr:endolytic transglycosylase MltG [Enterococcus plantarum]MBO0424127.1 endolytic transglycosylase MltG [Enterococcus plantarum]OEG18244.1 aminodeoxychorismate lyase [Enterococcus plantarum]
MAEDNQNNQDHSNASFKDQVLRSLRGEEIENDDSASSEHNAQNVSQHNEAEYNRTYRSQPDTQEDPIKRDEMESVGSRSAEHQTRRSDSSEEQSELGSTRSPKEDNSDKRIRKKEDRIVSRIVLIVASVLLLVIAIFGFTFYKYVNAGLQPLDQKDSKLVQVHIPEDSSNKKIANILEDSKVIKSGMVFNYYAKFKNLTDFQAGYYQMSPDMTLDEIGALLREGGTAEPTQLADGKVTIPEGFDIDKIGDAIEKNTNFKKDQFIELMKDQAFFDTMKEKYPELLTSAAEAKDVRYRFEGYLFPATYDYYKEAKLEDFVDQMIAKSNSVIEPFIPMVHAKGMTIQQVLTLASLVEKEGVKEEDRKKIAQVFFNRIAANMPLQSDISILYALGEHKELVTYKDLEVDSPYNLYKNTGYGPGPFDSPSEQAINAVLNPLPNNYLYFVADISTGNVYFAETYEQHQEYVEQYVNKTETEKSE